jgi:hypothetical protein
MYICTCVLCMSKHRDEGIAKESRNMLKGWFILRIMKVRVSIYVCV